jgi:hypothetical protein
MVSPLRVTLEQAFDKDLQGFAAEPLPEISFPVGLTWNVVAPNKPEKNRKRVVRVNFIGYTDFIGYWLMLLPSLTVEHWITYSRTFTT